MQKGATSRDERRPFLHDHGGCGVQVIGQADAGLRRVCRKFIDWRARLEADGGGLENRYECKLIKGSNPLPSASASASNR
jgi:hypothetical protein